MLDFTAKLYYHEIVDQLQQDIVEIQSAVVDRMCDALVQGALKQEELPVIAGFVLDEMQKVNDINQLKEFLRKFVTRWQLFAQIETMYLGKRDQLADKEAADSVLTLLNHGKVENALALAKKANTTIE